MLSCGAKNRAYGTDVLLLPGVGLLDSEANVKGKQSRQTSHPEHGSPSPKRQYQPGSNRSQKISGGISALNQARDQAAPVGGDAFEGQRRAHAPLTTHSDPKDSSQSEEDCVIRSEAAEQFNDGEKNHIRHQRTPAAIAVSQHP